MIERNLKKAVDERYDLIVIGGGVYGASLAMEAGRRGLRPLLLEREDFGGRRVGIRSAFSTAGYAISNRSTYNASGNQWVNGGGSVDTSRNWFDH